MLIGRGVVVGGGGNSLSPSTTFVFTESFIGGAYAGVRYNNDGSEERNSGSSASFGISRGNWLDSGDPASVWVEATLNSGSFTWTGTAGSRLQLNTSRTFGVFATSGNSSTAEVQFDFYDAASGGNLLASVTLTLSADANEGFK